MNSLEDLKNCCLLLSAEKITDRKRGSEKIRSLLNNQSILAALNAKTDGFNWKQVFHASCQFFFKEARRVEEEERSKPCCSQLVSNNRSNLKRSAAALPKFVLSKSCQKKTYINTKNVLDFVMLCLDKNRPYLLENFAGDCIQLLQKQLMWCPSDNEVSADTWRDLVKICIFLLKNEELSTHKVSLVQVLEGIVRCSSVVHPSARALQPLMNYLKEAMACTKLSSHYVLQSVLLSLLHTLTKNVAREWRHAMCELSEATFFAVLSMWEPRASQRQTNWLEYVNMVIILHHPQKDGQIYMESELVDNRGQWKRCLHHLYQLLYDCIDQLGNRAKLGGAATCTIPPHMVTLAARVFHKVFMDCEDYDVLELTQLGTQGGSSNKRRRIEFGLAPLTDHLNLEGKHMYSIPWFQVLHEMLTSHSAFFTSARCCLLLNTFTQVLAKCTHPLVQEELLRCLKALAVQYKKTLPEGSSTTEEVQAKWISLWDTTQGLVRGNQCSGSGLKLLRTLLELRLVLPMHSVYKLFYQGNVDMNEAALSTLYTLLTLQSLPNHFKNEFALSYKYQMQESRGVFLNVLLPLTNEDGGSVNTVALGSPTLLAHVLASLCLHDSNSAKDWIEIPQNIPFMSSKKHKNWWCDIEDLYLMGAMVLPLPLLPSQDVGCNGEVVEVAGTRMVPHHQDNVITRLVKFIQQLKCDAVFATEEGSQIIFQVVELLVTLLQHMPDQRLEDMLKDVLRLVESNIMEVSKKPESLRWPLLLPTLQALHRIYFNISIAPRHYKVKEAVSQSEKVLDLLINMTPPNLLSVVVDTAKSVFHQSPPSSQLGGRNLTQNTVSDSFDLDFDLMDGPSVSARDDFHQFEDDNSNSSLHDKVQDGVTLTNIESWSTQHQCVSAGLAWLICCIQPASTTARPHLNSVVTLIYDLIDNTTMEKVIIAVILKFVECMFVSKFNDDNVYDGLDILSALCDKYCSDPEVIESAVSTITALVHVSSHHLSDERKNGLANLVSVFFVVLKKNTYGQEVTSALLNLIIEMCKVDPLGKWRCVNERSNSVYDQISYFLDNQNSKVRCIAAQSVHHLLGGVGSMSAQHQDKAFENLYEATLRAVHRTNGESESLEGIRGDERHSGVWSMLLTLGVVAVNSPYLRSRALFALCRAIPEQHVNPALVTRLCTRVAECIGSNKDDMMQKELPYLVSQWVKHDYDITHFPPAILSCSSTSSFLSRHCTKLIPVLLECDRSCIINTLARSCDMDVKQLLSDNFHSIFAHILPYLAIDDAKSDAAPRAKITMAMKHYKMMEKELGRDQVKELMQKHIGGIVAGVVQLAHTPEAKIVGELVLTPVPLYFTPDVIHTTLQFIGKMFTKEQPLFAMLASDCNDELHLVLECCGKNLSESCTPPASRQALTSLEVVVDALLPCLVQHNCRTTPAILRCLTHTLTTHLTTLTTIAPHLAVVGLTKEETGTAIAVISTVKYASFNVVPPDYCLCLLSQVCNFAMENFAKHFVSLIPLLFSRLVPLCQKKNEVHEKCVEVLGSILASQHHGIQMCLSSLPPFPDHEEFTSLNELRVVHEGLVREHHGVLTLEEEVEAFLTLNPDHVQSHGLTHLLKILQKSRNEVTGLYKCRGVEQESLAHRLAHFLVNLASYNKQEVALEACKCLGVLGPVSFGTPVFYISDPRHNEASADDPDNYTALTVIKELNRYLTDDDMKVVVVASGVLQKLLNTPIGFHVFSQLPLITQHYLLLLTPHTKPKTMEPVPKGMDEEGYKAEIGKETLWQSGEEYGSWVTGLATALIQAGCGSNIISHLLPICTVKAEFSALVLPLVIHAALKTDTVGRRDVLSQQLSSFFHHHVQATKQGVSSDQKGMEMVTNKAAIQVLLSVIDFLRTQMPPRSFSSKSKVVPFEKNLWLNVNYLDVAQAAHYCGAHFSALLFLHLHCEVMQKTVMENADVESRRNPLLTQISSHPDASTFTTLLLHVYSNLGDCNSVEGCVGSSRFTDTGARALRYHHRGQWLHSFALRDTASDTLGMVEGLRAVGFFGTLSTFLNRTLLNQSQEINEVQWESAWRLSKWDDAAFEGQVGEDVALTDEEGDGFHKCLFKALQSLRHRDQPSMHQHISTARRTIASRLTLNRVESSSSIYPILSQLQILSETEAAAECLAHLSNPKELSTCVKILSEKWNGRELGMSHQYHEPILAARISSLKAVAAGCRNPHLDTLLHVTLLSKSKLGREGSVLAGVGCDWAVSEAQQLSQHLPPSTTWLTRLEEARVARKRGDVHLAIPSLQPLVQDFKQDGLMHQEHEQIMCQALTLYGCLLMDSHTSTPQTIIHDYFNVAVTILEGNTGNDSSLALEDTYHQLATYADQLYRQVYQHLESDTIQDKHATIKQSKEEIARVEDLTKVCTNETELRELLRKLTVLNKNIQIDCKMISCLETELQEYLGEALKNYLKCMQASSKQKLHVYRVVALWVQNLSCHHVNETMEKYIERIGTHLFVPLLYQLVARLSFQPNQNNAFHTILNRLLENVSVDHPHHSLPVVVALAHAHADHHFTSTQNESNKVIEEDRVQAAKALVMHLKNTSIGEHVNEFEKVSLSYLALANWAGRFDSSKKALFHQVKIDKKQPMLKLGNLRYTTALTRTLQVQASCHYDPPVIVSWGDTCTFVGGVNAPKRLTVRTSDGLQLFELLKGRDDLRQDAVMEQVFGIVNQLLAQNINTRERALSVRTYQVVPLSQRSGLIQWCNNTQTFGEYLIGQDKKSGAHKLYYPQDYSANQCYKKMDEAKPLSLEERHKVFKDILEHFHPVFRHFFLEQYPSAQEWQKRRAAYTRSVATTSMVGYILGLGDRHVDNILIDRSTAQLIHIDLGIAFELGKILPTPETVPFRMTQDMIDGLGVLGIAGRLRGDCEATLSVLRECMEVLVTVVEVLRHDPLHHWTLSPQQVARLQRTGDEDAIGMVSSASMADRVVLRVRQKLAGVEDGFPRTVSEQVATLLQQATDTSNLSRVFPGWRPFL